MGEPASIEAEAKSDIAPPTALRGRRWIRWALWVLRAVVWVVLVGVIVCELNAWLLPQDFHATDTTYIRFATAAFFTRTFQLHFAIGLIALAGVALAVRAWRGSAVSIALALLLALPYGRDYAPKHPPPAVTKTLRVMSINLWADNRDEAAILRAIDEADPDVLVLCEVTFWSSREIIHGRLRERYPYFHANRDEGGADVLSRVPFRVTPPIIPPGEFAHRSAAVFTIEGRAFALYAVHLVSPGRPWLVGYNRRQIESFARLAAIERRPMMIAGDFNFTQTTPNFARLRQAGFRTTHELAGFGMGNTWGPRWWPWLNRLPGVRIDHIFMTPPLTARTHTVGGDTGSDHRPIYADIGFAK